MIIRYIADVESHVVSSKKKIFELNGFTVKFHFDESGLEKVLVERRLNEEEFDGFESKIESFESDESPVDHQITISGIDDIRNNALRVLQLLESFFGLYGIEKIDWRNAEREFIPETEEEESEVKVGGFRIDRKYKRTPKRWELSFSNIDWDVVEKLKIPLSFHRKGIQYHQNFDYVESFINCYFIIEGFYSHGKHRNVEKEYLSSNELMDSVLKCLPYLLSEKGEELAPFFEFYEKEATPEGFVRLVTIMRHHLHHYFHNSNRPHSPNPFTVEDFQALSFSLLYLTYTILHTKTHN